MNNLEKFKEHLREAKKAGWDYLKLETRIYNAKCPFLCIDCTRNYECLKWGENCIFIKRFSSDWYEQTKWYQTRSWKEREDLIKIAKQVWEEK